MKEPKDKTSLEIVIDKIFCVEEAGIDYFTTDKFCAKIVIMDGKNPERTVYLPEPFSPAAYQSYISLNEGQSVEINRSIYKVEDVGQYIEMSITGYDQNRFEEDQVIGLYQIKFNESENWGKGKQHIAQCCIVEGDKVKSGVNLYYTLK
jgi:hypothetical protein